MREVVCNFNQRENSLPPFRLPSSGSKKDNCMLSYLNCVNVNVKLTSVCSVI